MKDVWQNVKETLKRIKADVILSAILCIALGVVLIVWSEETILVICKVLALGLILMGIVNMISYFMNRIVNPFSGALGLVVLLIGVWIFLRPESVVSLIPIVIGVILVIHGIQDFKLAFETKSNCYDRWWSILLLGIVSLALGVLCIVHAFGIVKLAMIFIGIALIYDGVSDIWIVSRTSKAVKQMKQDAEAFDVDYKEIDE